MRLPRSRWGACGISEVCGPDGTPVPTHALGDEHAANIIAGRVSFEAAVQEAKAAERQRWELSAGRAIRQARVRDLLREAGAIR